MTGITEEIKTDLKSLALIVVGGIAGAAGMWVSFESKASLQIPSHLNCICPCNSEIL